MRRVEVSFVILPRGSVLRVLEAAGLMRSFERVPE